MRVNGKIIIFVLLFSVFGFPPSGYCAKVEHNFDNLEKLFMEAKYDKAVVEADNLIDARANRRDEIYYLKGLSEVKLSRFSQARQSFEYIISSYPDSKTGFDAYTGIGDAYFLEGNTHSAIRVYKEALSNFPRDRNVSVVQKRLADCYRKLGQEETAASLAPKDDLKSISKGSFSVQVGSFIARGNAEKLAKKLSKKGYDAYVETPAGAGNRFYRVKVGRCPSMQEAQDLASGLKKSGYSTKICTDDICL